MVDREDQHQPVGALKRRVDRLKAHPLITVSATVVALGAFLINAEGVFVWGREKVNGSSPMGWCTRVIPRWGWFRW